MESISRRKFFQLTSATSAFPIISNFPGASDDENFGPGPTIREIHITPIAIVDPPLLNAAGLHAPYALRTILEIVTDDNISGISEIPGSRDTDLTLEEAKKVLIGKDVFRLNQIRQVLIEALAPLEQRRLVHIFSAVEVACMDIMGKVTGKPIYDLIGGKMRDRVPFSAYLFYKYEGAGGKLGFKTNPTATGWEAARQKKALNAKELVIEAQAMCKEFGFQSLKLKGGVFDPRLEVDTVLALREAFGSKVPLRIDPNALWKVETAIKYGKELEPVLEYLEDPVRGQEDMAKVRKEIKTPLATNMCTTSFEDIPNSIKVGSEDIILMDHHFWGGLRASVSLAAICDTFGRGMSMHSNSHLGISLAAMLHLGAAMPSIKYALDTHYPWQSDEIITGGRFKFEEGSVQVPGGPGLGVELDRAALARLHENYKACGLTKRNDEVEMQKVNPGWKFQSVRW